MNLILLATLLLQQGDFEKKLDELIPRLKAESIAERDKAQQDLHALVMKTGANARPILRARIAKSGSPALDEILLKAIRLLPTLEMKLETLGQAQVGKTARFKARIRNIGDETVSIVGSLDGSDSSLRFPLVKVEALGPDGKEREIDVTPRMCGNCARLQEWNVSTLHPGEELDPFGPDLRNARHLREWKPSETGKHTLKLTMDFSAIDASEWNSRPERTDMDLEKAAQILARIPRVKLTAQVEIDVIK